MPGMVFFELQNFVAIMLINRVLLTKYLWTIFYAFMAFFIPKICDGTVYKSLLCHEGVTLFLSKIMFVPDILNILNIETTGIG